MSRIYKQAFYHLKGRPNATYIRQTDDDIEQIKSDVRSNASVLDAVYNEATGKLTIYSKRKGYNSSDYLGNLNPIKTDLSKLRHANPKRRKRHG